MNKYTCINNCSDHNTYIKESIDKVCRDLNNNSSNRIILSGCRGSGKTTTLLNMENLGLGSRNKCIYMNFDISNFSIKRDDEVFDNLFLTHYYELMVSKNILNYVKKNYVHIYETYFNKLDLSVNNLLKDSNFN